MVINEHTAQIVEGIKETNQLLRETCNILRDINRQLSTMSNLIDDINDDLVERIRKEGL